MNYRKITINLPLTEEAKEVFDQAVGEFDSYFTDELSEQLTHIIQAHLRTYDRRISNVVIEIANDVAEGFEQAYQAEKEYF